MHLVDIILATFNGKKYIASQIESLLKQSFKDFRILMRDDISTDGTLEILKTYANSYPDKITLFPSEERIGIKANFSRLLSYSAANYTLFCDQDDLWEEDKIFLSLREFEKLENTFSKNSPLLIHTDLKVMSGDEKIISDSFWNYSGLNPSIGHSLNRLLMQNVVTGCAMMINKPLRELSLPIPESAVMHDWWIALLASAFGKIGHLDQATICYRQHGKNAVGAKKLYSFEYIKRGIKRLNQRDFQREYQAQELLKRYSNILTETQKKMIEEYSNLSKQNYLKRNYTIFKYKFFRMGLLRNLVGIVFNQ